MIAYGSHDTKAREGNHTRQTKPTTSLRNAPKPTPPHTGATWIVAMMDLDCMIAYGNLNAEEKEGNKTRPTELTTSLRNAP